MILSDVRLEEIKRIAEAARDNDPACWYDADSLRGLHGIDESGDAEYMETLSPDVALALVARVQRAEQEIVRMNGMYDAAIGAMEEAKRGNANLLVALERARRARTRPQP